MKVFVTGATGVIGHRAVAGLVAAGHDVTGIARGPQKAALLTRLGARPVNVSLFDADALRIAVAGHDAVVNLATKIPPITKMSLMSAWAENEQIRTEGSRNLVDAAIAAGASVFVQESLAFLYGDHGEHAIDASNTQWSEGVFTASMRAAEENVARFTASGGRGVVLRFGRFYAADSTHTQSIVAAARRGMWAEPGDAKGYAPAIDADDAASAVVYALDAPAGTYDIVDDDPLPRGEQARALANAVGRRRLHGGTPSAMLPKAGKHMGTSQRVSNRRFREITAWRPSSPSVREGWRKVAYEIGIEPALRPMARVLLWILALQGLALGVYASFFPRAFYDDFPNGRGWVAIDGPYNEHLIRDFGAMNLAMFVVAAGALVTASILVARVAAIAWLVFSVPHFVYHLRHLQHYETADKIGNVVSLGFGVLVCLALVWLTFRPARATNEVVLDDVEATPTPVRA
jgi:nucleoside-diphosphate-sugar epimerase